MAIRYAALEAVNFEQLYQTHNEAFADYQVDLSYMTKDRLRLRSIKNNVIYEFSVGAFDDDKMVGFTLVGMDDWQGEAAAYDAATGIIPTHRGKGIARGMFDFAVPGLKKVGVTKFLLEVLRPNEAAIKAYTKTGFRITRELDCFKLDLKACRELKSGSDLAGIEIRPVEKDIVMGFSDLTDWQPSWENSFAAMQRIPDELWMFAAYVKGQCAGIIVYYPLLNWIMSLVIKKEYRRRGIGNRLVRYLCANLSPDLEEVKMINVERSDKGMIKFLEDTGFEFTIGQYEMEYSF